MRLNVRCDSQIPTALEVSASCRDSGFVLEISVMVAEPQMWSPISPPLVIGIDEKLSTKISCERAPYRLIFLPVRDLPCQTSLVIIATYYLNELVIEVSHRRCDWLDC
jgi:hypothetical protein